MGKITVKDAQALKTSGVLSEAAITEMEDKGLVSKERKSTRRFMKPGDGKWVEVMLYFRGGKDTTLSKNQKLLLSDWSTIVEKYTTTRDTTNKTK